jgi:uncharacterized protein
MNTAQVARFPDGRLHLNHGPIDLILQAWGDRSAVARGEARAVARFDTILAELAAELPDLRAEHGSPQGPIARVMLAAIAPFRPAFITPMAAVAGAVAEAVLAQLVGPGISRAYVNNGGDIALYLTPGESLTCAIATRPGTSDRLTIHASDPVRGIATSGWRGRSWSFGIADSVTVLAKTASMADAAATMIANAVDLPAHPGITRRPANSLQADSDLGARLVTTGVAGLTQADITAALARGETVAASLRAAGLVEAAALFLHPERRCLGPIHLEEPTHA